MPLIHYCLFDSKEERRHVIAPVDHPDYWRCDRNAGTYAESWLDAKQRMGFDLTPEQKWLHDRQLAA